MPLPELVSQDAYSVEKEYNSDNVFADSSEFTLATQLPLRVINGGLFVSRGEGCHPARIISSYELIFVSEGVLSLQEEERSFSIKAGESLILWPDRRHFGTLPFPPTLAFYWVHFHLLEQQGKETHQSRIPQQASIQRPDHLISLFRRFLDDQETAGVQALPASMLVMLMLHEVAGAAPAQNSSQSAATILANRTNTLIKTQFHKPLSTSSLAKQLHCNPDYLGRVFHQVYGRTLTEAIHQRRLDRACKLLLESDRTVGQVAYDCGFNDIVYFRRLFKRAKDMTPRKFRELYAHLHVNTG